MRTLMLDGAMGTELASRGCHVADSLWSARALLEHPEAIEQIHYDYLAAGSDIITSASYQVSFPASPAPGSAANKPPQRFG